MNFLVIFLTGLTVGGLTCLAVQGGLLASVIAAREEEASVNKTMHGIYATVVFLIAKFLSYAVLGAILGAFGGVINISEQVQTIVQLMAGIYMLAVALSLLNIHPIFRYAMLQPPRILTRLVRNQSKSKDIFAPALLGAMTIFIPCGTTLAMEALAISSTNAFSGAAVMAVFILGTIPLFFGIGATTSLLGQKFKIRFLKLAAIGVLYLGIMSVNGALVALGFPFTLQSLGNGLAKLTTVHTNESRSKQPVLASQHHTIEITAAGYAPNYIRVHKGKEVILTLQSKNAYSCASAFRIPHMGIARNLTANDTEVVSFTPDKEGKYIFSCSMGMYQGVIEVI